MPITKDMLDNARALGDAFAISDSAGGAEMHGKRDLSEWGAHEDMPTIADVWEESTGYDYPEELNDDNGDEVNSIGDAFNEGYAAHWAELEAVSAPLVTPMPDTAFNRRMAEGHAQRKGHALDARHVSSDGGVLWHRVALCCGETIPASVPTFASYTGGNR